MIELEVDCNNDIVSIKDDNDNVICELKVSQPNKYIKFFDELFNRINNLTLVKLTKVDDDVRTTIGEW